MQYDFTAERAAMVERLARRGIVHPAVLRAMATVYRHRFVPEVICEEAYGDHRIPIWFDQMLAEPYVVGIMSQLLDPEPGMTVLEIGTGTGYQTAVLCELGCQVQSVEIHAGVAARARTVLFELGYTPTLLVADGGGGVPEHAPYDRILLTAAPPRIPELLLAQLAEGGRLVGPVGDLDQVLVQLDKHAGEVTKMTHEEVAFEPMSGTAWG